jgi:DNA-binding NarL/FixJ family response regulator
MIISEDKELLNLREKAEIKSDEPIQVFNSSKDPLDAMSTVCELNPSLLIVDDDFLHPNTVHVLEAVRKVNKSIKIIFFTSNTSIDLGKRITPLGISYYAMKPLDENELIDSFRAVMSELNKASLNV